MKINIYGSTGEIGKKTLSIISKNFPNIKVNLLCANSSVNLIYKQIKKYNPKYVYLSDIKSSNKLRALVKSDVNILSYSELNVYLKNSVSDLSILAIAGYKSLYFIDQIVNNTKNLGLVSKEVIVSAGHIFKKKNYFKKTNIIPIDSEHYSLFDYLSYTNSFKKIKTVTLTASGGPFYKKKYSSLKNVSFKEASQHPKWKMGYKNSIDSATLVNKCLEVIEAHYLFNIPYNKINILIHPEAIVHSIVEKNNYVTNLNLFKNDMSIPLLNFFILSHLKPKIINKNLELKIDSSYNFHKVKYENFPIYNYFVKLDKSNPSNLIKFNIGNEYAVNMFKLNKIKYTDIYRIIKKVGSLNLYSSLNTINSIIKYHEEIEKRIKILFKNNI